MVDALHLLTAYAAKIALEPALIDGADLLQQQRGIGTKHTGGYRHMHRKFLFRLLCGNSCDDGRRTIEIADVILQY